MIYYQFTVNYDEDRSGFIFAHEEQRNINDDLTSCAKALTEEEKEDDDLVYIIVGKLVTLFGYKEVTIKHENYAEYCFLFNDSNERFIKSLIDQDHGY